MSYALTHPGSADIVTVAHLRNQVQHLDEQYARQVRDPAAEGLALLRKAMIALYGERNPQERACPSRADGGDDQPSQ